MICVAHLIYEVRTRAADALSSNHGPTTALWSMWFVCVPANAPLSPVA